MDNTSVRIINPKISIIMPNYNGEKYLSTSINSFLNQKYNNKELIIVDGKSTDSSHNIIEEYSALSSNIKWVHEIDKGISDAINIGIALSKGDIIGYLGSDDILYNDILDEIAYSYSWCEYDAVYFDSYTYYINENRCILRKCPNIEFSKNSLLSYGTLVGLQNIFFKRHIYDIYNYDVNNKYSMDYEFYLKISEEKYLYLYVEKIATINIFDSNITNKLHELQYSESCEVAKKYSTNYRGYLYFGKNSIYRRVKGAFRRIILLIGGAIKNAELV